MVLGISAAYVAAAQQPRAGSATQAMYNAEAQSAAHKFQHIEQNAQRSRPDQTPTVVSEREINSYLLSGQVQLPDGVKHVDFVIDSGRGHATARVDFDQITKGRYSGNPLMALFKGVHEVVVYAHASGSGHMGQVHVDSVAIDGVSVPGVALEYFIDHYLKPKHPEIGIDSRFQLPYKIDLAELGTHRLTLTQK